MTDVPGHGDGGPLQPDFELEFYKLHRAHEAALNNATGSYEQSLLRLILVLNAASIGAFLSLMNIGKEAPITYDPQGVKCAIWKWAIGIGCAFLSTAFGYVSQRKFTQAHRYRRQAIEKTKAKTPGDLGITKTKDTLNAMANNCRAWGGYLQYGCIAAGALAAIMAVVGFYYAISAVTLRPKETFQPPAQGGIHLHLNLSTQRVIPEVSTAPNPDPAKGDKSKGDKSKGDKSKGDKSKGDK